MSLNPQAHTMTGGTEAFDRISEDGNSLSFEQLTKYLRKSFSGCDDDERFEHRVHSIVAKYGCNDVLSRTGFLSLWQTALKKCLEPKSALVVVDFQNDFIDGTLSLKRCPRGQNPETLLPRLNELIVHFDEVVYTKDWHPKDHISFIECKSMQRLHESNRVDPETVKVAEELVFDIDGKPYVQKMWPRHCVQHTEGADLHKDLNLKESAIIIHKGTNPDIDSYSAFWDNGHVKATDLKDLLSARNISNLFIVGLAFDACVLFTALDAVSEGFTAAVVEDLTAGISDAMTSEARVKLAEIECPRISSQEALRILSNGSLPWIYVWQQIQRSETFREQEFGG